MPELVATMASTGEIVLPMLLAFGLLTRWAALGLLCMTGVIQLTYPDGWANFHFVLGGDGACDHHLRPRRDLARPGSSASTVGARVGVLIGGPCLGATVTALEWCGLQHRFPTPTLPAKSCTALHADAKPRRRLPFAATRASGSRTRAGNMLTPRRRRPVALTNLIDEGFTPVSGNPSPNPLRTAGLVESHQARPSLRPRFLLRAPRPAAPRGLARGPRFRCALAFVQRSAPRTRGSGGAAGIELGEALVQTAGSGPL